jgi:hypothetical protein
MDNPFSYLKPPTISVRAAATGGFVVSHGSSWRPDEYICPTRTDVERHISRWRISGQTVVAWNDNENGQEETQKE